MKKYIIGLILSWSFFSLSAQSKYLEIHGNLKFLKPGDSVTLTIHRYGVFESSTEFSKEKSVRVSGHTFMFKELVKDYPEYIDITFTSATALSKNIFSILTQPGDHILMTEKDEKYCYTGKGSVKYNVNSRLHDIYLKWVRKVSGTDTGKIGETNRNVDSSIFEQLAYLDSHRTHISKFTYSIFKDDILATELLKGNYWCVAQTASFQAYKNALVNYQPNKIIELKLAAATKDPTSIIHTNYFLEGIYNRYRIDSCYVLNKPFHLNACYDFLKKNYSGLLRDGLVTWLIYHKRNSSEDLSFCINDALTYVEFSDFRNLLLKLKATQFKGAEAYDFHLPGSNGKVYSLSDFRGKVVLIDFWYTGCAACRELNPYREKVENAFKDQQVVFASISIDKNKEMWLNSLKEGGYTSSDEINMFTEGKGMKHPIISHYNISAFPDLILIDKKGRISYKCVDPRQDNGIQLSEMIKKAISE